LFQNKAGRQDTLEEDPYAITNIALSQDCRQLLVAGQTAQVGAWLQAGPTFSAEYSSYNQMCLQYSIDRTTLYALLIQSVKTRLVSQVSSGSFNIIQVVSQGSKYLVVQ
jgi:hypothetical protein